VTAWLGFALERTVCLDKASSLIREHYRILDI
jgi:hypothetical protein